VEIDAPKYTTLIGSEKFPATLPGDNEYVKYRFKEKPENYDDLISDPKTTVEIVPDREVVKREVDGVEAGRSDEDLLNSFLTHKGFDKPRRDQIIKTAKKLAEAMS